MSKTPRQCCSCGGSCGGGYDGRPCRQNSKLSESQIARIALDAMGQLMTRMQSKTEKSEALSLLMMTSYKLLRTIEGDEFVVGFLEAALHECRTQPPDIALQTVQ